MDANLYYGSYGSQSQSAAGRYEEESTSDDEDLAPYGPGAFARRTPRDVERSGTSTPQQAGWSSIPRPDGTRSSVGQVAGGEMAAGRSRGSASGRGGARSDSSVILKFKILEELSSGVAICRNHLFEAGCSWGASCRYLHVDTRMDVAILKFIGRGDKGVSRLLAQCSLEDARQALFTGEVRSYDKVFHIKDPNASRTSELSWKPAWSRSIFEDVFHVVKTLNAVFPKANSADPQDLLRRGQEEIHSLDPRATVTLLNGVIIIECSAIGFARTILDNLQGELFFPGEPLSQGETPLRWRMNAVLFDLEDPHVVFDHPLAAHGRQLAAAAANGEAGSGSRARARQRQAGGRPHDASRSPSTSSRGSARSKRRGVNKSAGGKSKPKHSSPAAAAKHASKRKAPGAASHQNQSRKPARSPQNRHRGRGGYRGRGGASRGAPSHTKPKRRDNAGSRGAAARSGNDLERSSSPGRRRPHSDHLEVHEQRSSSRLSQESARHLRGSPRAQSSRSFSPSSSISDRSPHPEAFSPAGKAPGWLRFPPPVFAMLTARDPLITHRLHEGFQVHITQSRELSAFVVPDDASIRLRSQVFDELVSQLKRTVSYKEYPVDSSLLLRKVLDVKLASLAIQFRKKEPDLDLRVGLVVADDAPNPLSSQASRGPGIFVGICVSTPHALKACDRAFKLIRPFSKVCVSVRQQRKLSAAGTALTKLLRQLRHKCREVGVFVRNTPKDVSSIELEALCQADLDAGISILDSVEFDFQTWTEKIELDNRTQLLLWQHSVQNTLADSETAFRAVQHEVVESNESTSVLRLTGPREPVEKCRLWITSYLSNVHERVVRATFPGTFARKKLEKRLVHIMRTTERDPNLIAYKMTENEYEAFLSAGAEAEDADSETEPSAPDAPARVLLSQPPMANVDSTPVMFAAHVEHCDDLDTAAREAFESLDRRLERTLDFGYLQHTAFTALARKLTSPDTLKELEDEYKCVFDINRAQQKVTLYCARASDLDDGAAFIKSLTRAQSRTEYVKLAEDQWGWAVARFVLKPQRWRTITDRAARETNNVRMSKAADPRNKDPRVKITGSKPNVDRAVAWLSSVLDDFKARMRQTKLNTVLTPTQLRALIYGPSCIKLEIINGFSLTFPENSFREKIRVRPVAELAVAQSQDASSGPASFIRVMSGDIFLLVKHQRHVSGGFDAVVNAANSRLENHGGLALEFSRRGGRRLEAQCRGVIERNGPVHCGEAVITSSGDIDGVAHVVHTVGPSKADGPEILQGRSHEELLHSCAFNSLDCLYKAKRGPASLRVAFPAVSTGIYAIPARVAAKGLIAGILGWIAENPSCHVEAFICIKRDHEICEDFVKELESSSRDPIRGPRPPPPRPRLQRHGELVQWYWEESSHLCPDGKVWKPYDLEQNLQIEVGRQAGQSRITVTGDVLGTKNGSHYAVIIKNGVPVMQQNEATDYCRPLCCGPLQRERREAPKSRSELPRDPAAFLESVQQLTGASAAFGVAPQMSAARGTLDTRTFSRCASESAAPRPRFGGGPGSHTSPIGDVVLECERSEIDRSLHAIQQHLTRCCPEKTLDVPSGAIDISELQEDHPDVAFELSADGTQLSFSAVSVQSFKAADGDVSKQIVEFAKRGVQVAYPDTWDMGSSKLLNPVDASTPEFQNVLSLMRKTMPRVTISRLERIQNRHLYDYFDSALQLAEKKQDARAPHLDRTKTLELFHGTRSTAPSAIYENASYSFDMRFSNSGMWGRAAYFAVNASYSNSYRSSAGGQTQMFLATVIVGAHMQLASDATLRTAPAHPELTRLRGMAEEADSVLGNTGGSDVYMIYANNRAYPSYLITYSESG